MKLITLLILSIGLISCNAQNSSTHYPDWNKGKIELDMSASPTELLELPKSENVLVLRTDFSDDTKWAQVCDLIAKSGKGLGFQPDPNIDYLSDKKFDKLKNERLLNRSHDYEHPFIFVVDIITIYDNEHPILCIDLYNQPGQYFRTLPSEMWDIENNLSLSNMDFEEFYQLTDDDGIFRSF